LRKIRELVGEVLKELNHTFGRLYSHEGRPSIPPEQLLSALILQVLYSVRSERQLTEQLDYNLLFRWFVGLSPDDPIWDPTVFTKNRERLQQGDVFQKFMGKLLKHEKVKPLLSDEHFSVDGTLIEAWASHKSFKPKQAKTDDDGSNFHGQRRKNDTHQSMTDPEAKLYRKAAGREAKLRSWRTGTALRSAAWLHRRTARLNGALRRPCSRNKPNAQSASPLARTKPTTPAITLQHCAR
jgi:transposase